EARLQAGMDRRGVQRRHQAFAADGVRTSHRSCWIFSWSFTRPSVSASGRGGQPGTYTSTGITLSTPSHTEYASWKSPPQLAQLPIDTTYFGSGIWSYRTLVRSAILSVSVPDTMIRSETRGVARGAMPKRSRSERGPPVCIISIAQQASPNIMYQTDDFRVQLRKSSTVVVSAISGAVLM